MDDSDNFFPGMFDSDHSSPLSPPELEQSNEFSSLPEEVRREENTLNEASNSNSQHHQAESNTNSLTKSNDPPYEEPRYKEYAPIEASNSNSNSISQPHRQTDSFTTPIPNSDSNSPTSNPGKYFYYDSPLYEETGIWIPVSVPPMTGTSFPDSSAPFLSSGAYFPDEEFNWDPITTPNSSSETTMWDIFTEMALSSKSKISSLTSLNNIYHHTLSFTSVPVPISHDQSALQEAWKEITSTLSEAQFGFENSILESEPVKWLPDSVSQTCMLCSAKFHPIICPRHHCRFCGGIFCGDCSKGRSLMPHKFRVSEPQRVCDVCGVRLEGVQRYLMGRVSRAAQETVNDVTDLTTLRSWMNFPWGRGMEYEIYKAANSLRSYCKVGGKVKGEKSIPESILKQAKGLAIITVANVGVMVTYKIGTGLVIARRDDGSWSPPSAVSTFGLGWGPQAGGEITDYIIVLRNTEAVKTFCGTAHLSFGAGFGAAIGVAGRVAEADLRAGDGGYAACYTYSITKGAFVGCALNGSIITTRQTENSRFYGAPIKASEILLGSTPPPPAANILYQALTNLFEKIDKIDKAQPSKYNIYPALSTI